MMQGMMGAGTMRRGTDNGMGQGHMGGAMWSAMGFRLLLADKQGVIVADSDAALTGSAMPAADLAAGTPVVSDGQQIGTLMVVAATSVTPSPAAAFLSALNRSTWLSSLAAGGLALVLGIFLFRQTVGPVRSVTSAAQRIAAGELDQRVPVTSRDEIGQLAVAFNQMAESLAHDQQLRRNMNAGIAHELRTPLSVMQANLEAMLDGVLSPTPQELTLLHEKTLLLSRLVADLRLLSLAEAGQLKLEYRPVDLAALLKSEAAHMQVQAEQRHIHLETELQEPLPTLQADADRIRQVLSNLLGNALRYTDAGGRIVIRAFEPRQSNNVREVVVEVSDNGQGIAPEDLPYLFDHFYRADKSRSRASGGSGIGLAIVKQLVEAHRGRVWVESKVGKGATFSFALPVPGA
jgi:signal transduction histidine kinase